MKGMRVLRFGVSRGSRSPIQDDRKTEQAPGMAEARWQPLPGAAEMPNCWAANKTDPP
jgi:hypothetical protein